MTVPTDTTHTRTAIKRLVHATAAAACWVAFAAQAGDGESPALRPELAAVLAQLAGSTSPENARQCADAIGASPTLRRRFGEFAASGALTRIDIVVPRPGSAAVRGPFSAAVDGSHLVFAEPLLAALRKDRLFDVARADDVLPNNTVFVLAHLGYHLAHPRPQRPGPDDTLTSWVAGRIADEAAAWIAAWNATVEEATVRNGGTALTGQQVATLLLNCRFRFALMASTPAFLPGGALAASAADIDAVSKTLERSPVSDVE